MFEVSAVAYALLVDLSVNGLEPAMKALERVEESMPARTSRFRDRMEFVVAAGGDVG